MNKVVLLAEESPTARAILGHILKQMDFDVREAEDRAGVVRCLSKDPVFTTMLPAGWLAEDSDGNLLREIESKCIGEKPCLVFTGESGKMTDLPQRAAAGPFINISNDAGNILLDMARVFTELLENAEAAAPAEKKPKESARAGDGRVEAKEKKAPEKELSKTTGKTGPEKEPEKPKKKAESGKKPGERTILLVDDSPLIIGMNSECLSGAGYKIVTASDGVEGAEKAFEIMPDLIVSDVEMPRMNGYQMVRLLKSSEQTRHIPVVMNTTLSEAKDRFWGTRAGADNYLVKGATADELLRTVDRTFAETEDLAEAKKGGIWGDSEVDVVERVNYLLDSHLFRSTIVSEVRSYSQSITDFELTIKRILEFLADLIDHEISILYLPHEKEVFVNVAREVSERAIEQAWEILEKETGDAMAGRDESPDIIMLNEERVQSGGGSGDKIFSFIHCVSIAEGERSMVPIVLAVFTGEKNKYGDPHRETLRLIAEEARLVAESSFLYRNLDRANERNEKLQNLLKSYISRSAWEDAMDTVDKGGNILSEQEKEYTMLFSDICGFTSISERLSAKQVIDFLNTHFSFVTTVVQANHGDIDKYIGDCIMGKFEDPADAVRSAFQIQNILNSGQHALAGMGIKNLQVRVGINTGMVIEGSIGSHARKDYTVIGDAVNTASRVESACPKGEVMITQSTYEKVSDIVDVITEDVIKVKGKEIELHVYVVSEKGKRR